MTLAPGITCLELVNAKPTYITCFKGMTTKQCNLTLIMKKYQTKA